MKGRTRSYAARCRRWGIGGSVLGGAIGGGISTVAYMAGVKPDENANAPMTIALVGLPILGLVIGSLAGRRGCT